MTSRCIAFGAASTLAILATGCATIPPNRGFDRVQDAVAGRVETTPQWPADAAAELAVQSRVNELLQMPLTAESASEIALLNSPRLRALYARVGIAVADFVKAGLLDNPRLSTAVGFPNGQPRTTGLDFGLTLNILRLLMMPAQKQIAALQLDAATLDAADNVLGAAAEARIAFIDLQAAEHLTSVLQEIALAAQASAEFAHRVQDAGNMSDLDVANEEALFEQARVEYARSRAEADALRQRLNAVLGLWGERTDWTIVDRLPELPASEPDMSDLESLAIRQRFDLAATAKEVEAFSKALGLQREWRYILSADVGALASRDTDGQWVFAPELSIELPIFNRRQAEIARFDAALSGAKSRLNAIAIETRADVRRLLDRLYALRYEAERYKDAIVPLHQRITRLTQEQYNFMLKDTFDLLSAKRSEIDTYRVYLMTIHDYWTTRAQLERAVGGRLPQVEAAQDAAADSPRTPKPDQLAGAQSSHNHGVN